VPLYGATTLTLKCRAIDRIFLQADIPKLPSVGQVCIFLSWQRKFKIPSAAALGKIGEAYTKAILKFAERHHLPRLHFPKGKNKEEVAHPYWEAAAREGKDRVGCSYKSSRIKQYCKKGRALRSETVIRETHDSASVVALARRTGMPCGRLVNPPTGVGGTPKPPTRSPLPRWPPFAGTVDDHRGSPCRRTWFGEARGRAVPAAWVGSVICSLVSATAQG